MKQNVGNADKVVRLILAVIVVILYFMHVISGTAALLLLGLAGILILTSLISFCPLYLPFGISTRKKENK